MRQKQSVRSGKILSSSSSLPWRVGDAGIGGRWIEKRVIGCACAASFSHRVVDFQDDTLGAVLAVFLLVFAFDDGEGLYDGVTWSLATLWMSLLFG